MNLFTLVFVSMIISSCNFRIVENTGHQYSSEIKWSREFDVFLCSYKPDFNTMPKHIKYKINQVFTEHQYRHDGGLFSGFEIDKNSSQIIVTDSIEGNSWQNDSCSFGFIGYRTMNGSLYYKFINSSIILDTLKLELVNIDFKSKEKETDELIYIQEK